MKVIELLNKMAGNENYRPTFLFRGSIYKYNVETKYYEPSFMGLYKIFMILNDEVEIIKDKPKKIESLELVSFPNFKEMCPEERYVITAKEYDKIEELTDRVNYLLEKSDSSD